MWLALMVTKLREFVGIRANAKQHLETELLLFENYSHSSPMLSSKNCTTYYIT